MQQVLIAAVMVRMLQEQTKLGSWIWVVEVVSIQTGLTILVHRWMGAKRARKCFMELTEAFGGCLPGASVANVQ